MSRGKKKNHSPGRSVQDYSALVKAIKSSQNNPTKPQTYILRTLDQSSDEDEEVDNSVRRRSKGRRFQVHMKENWPSYLIGIVLSAFGFLFVTIYPKVITNETNVGNNTKSIETVVTDLKDTKARFQDEQDRQDEIISANSGDIQSIRESFLLYVEMTRDNKSVQENKHK